MIIKSSLMLLILFLNLKEIEGRMNNDENVQPIKVQVISVLIMIITTLILGLFSRSHYVESDTLFSIYGGDILWAAMTYWGICLLSIKKETKFALICAILFCYVIEFSQFYKGEWILYLRSTTLGALILGHGFLISDLYCYTIGIFLSFMMDSKCIRK